MGWVTPDARWAREYIIIHNILHVIAVQYLNLNRDAGRSWGRSNPHPAHSRAGGAKPKCEKQKV